MTGLWALWEDLTFLSRGLTIQFHPRLPLEGLLRGPLAQHQQSRSMSWSGHEWQGLQVTAAGVGVGNTPPCASDILLVLLRAVGLALLFW